MADATIDFRLGQLTAAVNRLCDEVTGVRAEGREREARITAHIDARMDEHEDRDERRFAELFRRTAVLEQSAARRAGGAAAAAEHGRRVDDRRNLVHSALITAAAALGGGILASTLPALVALITGGHG